MTILTFPANPTTGDVFVGPNSATYTWTGSYWSSRVPILSGDAKPVAEGGYADSIYEQDLDGGGA